MKIDYVLAAAKRIVIGSDENHPDWYDGMRVDGEVEIEKALKEAALKEDLEA